MIAATLVFLLINIDIVIDGAGSGLAVCARTIIPSLFPFMVLSELVMRSGIAQAVGSVVERPFSKAFRISGCGVCPAILGALCGFPVGAKSAVSLYEQGILSKDETERLIAFSNNTGPAFVIGGIGLTLWKSEYFGIMLYFVQIISAVIVGMLLTPTAAKTSGGSRARSVTSPPPFSQLISEGVVNAANAVLSVCGFVVFFSVLSKAIAYLFSGLIDNPTITGFIYTFLEVGSGSSVSAAIGSEHIISGSALAAFAVGWSGLSVHFQTMYFTAKYSLSLKRYFYGKLMSGILCTFFTLAVIAVFPSIMSTVAPTSEIPVFLPATPNILAYTADIFFAVIWLAARISRLSAKKRNA